jgi:hypothetical protein
MQIVREAGGWWGEHDGAQLARRVETPATIGALLPELYGTVQLTPEIVYIQVCAYACHTCSRSAPSTPDHMHSTKIRIREILQHVNYVHSTSFRSSNLL